MAVGDYEDVTSYTLDPDVQEDLLRRQNECTFIWNTRSGWPVGVIMSYIWRDGKIWVTSAKQRPRVTAVRRDPRVCVVVSSAGTGMGPKALTMKGRCTFHEDAETKRWFYPALAKILVPGNEAQQRGFVKMLDSPHRTIIAVTPEHCITFDGDKMAAASGGGLGMSQME